MAMRAAVVREYGPPDVIRVEDVAVPRPAPDEVLVEIVAASVNFPDLLIVADRYQVSVPTPFVPGSDLAGTVVEVGDGVVDLAPGQRVAATMTAGAFAQFAVVPRDSLTPLPSGVDLADAAAFGVVYPTAYHAAVSVAALEPGEAVCVLGAGSGVGLAALDLALLQGSPVVAVATGAAKLELCRQRGASATVDLSTDDLRARLKELGGVDVVLDMIGGPWSEQALRGLRPGGRFVTIGYTSGVIPRIPLNLVLLKGISILGFGIRSFVARFPQQSEAGRKLLLDHLASGRIRPYVGARFGLDRIVEAMQLLADRAALGKIVIDVGAPA